MQNDLISETIDNAKLLLSILLKNENNKPEIDNYLIQATINDLSIVERKALLFTVVQEALKG